MDYKKVDGVYIVRISRGEEIIGTLLAFADAENIQAASIEGIGAAEDVVLGWYNVAEQEYEWKTFSGQWEVTSLLGNITHKDRESHVHIHMTITGQDFTATGGHLKEATVSGACELFIRPLSEAVSRVRDDETGLHLLSL